MHIGLPEAWSYERVIAHRRGKVRRRYLAAYQRFQPLCKRDTIVKSFVKWEQYPDDGKARFPRMIQFRSPRFNMQYGRFIYPLEGALYKLKPDFNLHCRIFAKGRNLIERANDIKKMEKWDKTAWLLLDFSKFDSHVNVKHLRRSHKFRYRIFGKQSDLVECQNAVLRNTTVTPGGCFTKVKGRRMSGEVDTGEQNSEISYNSIEYALFGIPHATYVDGDDSVISFPKEYEAQVRLALESRIPHTGFKAEYSIVYNYFDVDFCQSKPIFTNGRYQLAREPLRAVSRMFIAGGFHLDINSYLRTLGIGESHSSSGVPVLYEIAQKLRGARGRFFYENLAYRHKINLKIEPVEPDSDARATFWTAFGLDPQMQRSLVSVLETLNEYDSTNAQATRLWKEANSEQAAAAARCSRRTLFKTSSA